MEYTIKPMTGKKILITGGLGFIGSNTAIKLLDLGADITLISRTKQKLRNIKGIEDKVNLILGDITDKEIINKTVKDKDIIFNFAGQTSHIYSMSNPLNDIDINCVGMMNILEACRKHNDSAKILFAGTITQAGRVSDNELPITEHIKDNPIDIYSADKLAAEKYLIIYNKVYGIRTTSIRLSTIYGERQEVTNTQRGITNLFIKKAICGELISIYGDGSFIRDYNYIGNVVDALLLASQIDKTNGHYFVLGSNKPTKFVDMVKTVIEKVKEVTGKEGTFKFVPWPADIKRIDQGNIVVDYTKLNNFTGWYPKITLEEGIKRTAEFYKERLNEYL
jgi:nucleoside-diphosphate-sugar epimerase